MSICSISISRLTPDSEKYRAFLIELVKQIDTFNGATSNGTDYAAVSAEELPDMPRFQLTKDVRARVLEKSARKLVESILDGMGESVRTANFVVVDYNSF